MNPSEKATIASTRCRSWMSHRWCSNPHSCIHVYTQPALISAETDWHFNCYFISAKWTEWNWRIYCFHCCLSVCLCVCVCAHSVQSTTVCVPPTTHHPSPTPISYEGDEISAISHLVFEIWRGRETIDRRDNRFIRLLLSYTYIVRA